MIIFMQIISNIYKDDRYNGLPGINLDVEQNVTIGEMKKKIYEETDIPVDKQDLLIYVELPNSEISTSKGEDTKTLKDYICQKNNETSDRVVSNYIKIIDKRPSPSKESVNTNVNNASLQTAQGINFFTDQGSQYSVDIRTELNNLQRSNSNTNRIN